MAEENRGKSALAVLFEQLGKTAEKQPGWVYLLATTYVLLPWLQPRFHLPSRIGVWGRTLPISAEVWAPLLTFVAYGVGDALDKITFKKRVGGRWIPRYKSDALREARAKAEEKLEVRDGIYKVAMSLLEAAHQAKLSVHLVNEGTKFFRSLILPAYVVCVLWSLRLGCPRGLILLTFASALAYVLAWWVYPPLKTYHMTNLYRTVRSLIEKEEKDKDSRFGVNEAGEFRLFFWEGRLVASGRRVPPR